MKTSYFLAFGFGRNTLDFDKNEISRYRISGYKIKFKSFFLLTIKKKKYKIDLQ
ncbi:MAG: hypothetical protein LBR59_01035 [Endomicrobium sp.]|jgi:hypothetical protein|nr:hypothetical protein [Endomicrobium sp.]